MPLNPRRVQAVFLEAADCHDPVDPATILDRGCSADLELPRTAADPARRRVDPSQPSDSGTPTSTGAGPAGVESVRRGF